MRFNGSREKREGLGVRDIPIVLGSHSVIREKVIVVEHLAGLNVRMKRLHLANNPE